MMSIKTISSRKFNQDVSQAKRCALRCPVFITDRGRVAHVLLNIAHYQKITDTKQNISELLAMPHATKINFDPPRFDKNFYRPADFS
jgi:hypothetical protein